MAVIWDMLVKLGMDTGDYSAGLNSVSSSTKTTLASMSTNYDAMGSTVSKSMQTASRSVGNFAEQTLVQMSGIPPALVPAIAAFGALGLAVVGVLGLLALFAQADFSGQRNNFRVGDKVVYSKLGTPGGFGPQPMTAPSTNSTASALSTATAYDLSAQAQQRAAGGYASGAALIDYDRLGRIFRDAAQQVVNNK